MPASPTSQIEVVVCPPQTGEEDCEGKSDDRLAEITKMALQMFGELADLGTRDRVEILTVRHGWRLPDVEKALGISQQAVNKHWQNIMAELDVEQLPARQRGIMARQCEAQYQRASRMMDSARGIPIALKALELKAKLLGLNLETVVADTHGPAYTPPEDIAGRVNDRILALHGRGSLLTTNEDKTP